MGRKDLCNAYIGTSFKAKNWLSLDACGLCGVSFSWLVHFYALFVNGLVLISNSMVATIIFFALYVPTSFLAMASLYRAWTTDPGAVPMGARPLTIVRRASSRSVNGESSEGGMVGHRRRGVRRCHKCDNSFKPARAHHDSVTGRCIVKFDHFCPWVGNAVGALNHKFFCLFLLYTAGTCLLSLLLLSVRVIHCGYLVNPDEKEEALSDAAKRAYERGEDGRMIGGKLHLYQECDGFYESRLVLGLLVASLVFLVFTCVMGCEQIEAIETGKGKIARMKMSVGQAGTEFSRVTEEFNEMFGGASPRVSWHWFWPDPVHFPNGMKKVVLGYEWDPSFPEPYESDGDQEMDEMENGKVVNRVPSTVEGDGLVRVPSIDNLSEVSVSDDNRNLKNRKRQDGTDSDSAVSTPRLT